MKQRRFRVPCEVLIGGAPSIDEVFTDDDGFLTTKYGEHFETWTQAHEYLIACAKHVEERARLKLMQAETNLRYARELTPNGEGKGRDDGLPRKTRAEVQRCGTTAQGAPRNPLATTS